MMFVKALSSVVLIFLCCTLSYAQSSAAKKDTPASKNLIFPYLLEKEQREAGNPLATYAALVDLENEYRSGPFSVVYDEIRYNFEQFLGFPEAGKKALHLPQFKTNWSSVHDFKWASWSAYPAMEIITSEAKKTRIVIWGEEHHLPQTRALFEDMVRNLWKLGYRYLAAETFAEGIRDDSVKFVNYQTGYYTADPVYASAINLAIRLGYKLVDYDTKETSATDPSFRDIRQAENINDRIFKKDANAKVLVIAGRGHASERVASNGWRPMASVLKEITGINPFTLYAPTMAERLQVQEEHPLYREATEKKLLKGITIFKNRDTGNYLNNGSFDAYVFFPRVTMQQGRPDWMFTILKRKPVDIPFRELGKQEPMVLVQAFYEGLPASSIPADQVILSRGDRNKTLALSPGRYWLRAIDPNGNTIARSDLVVK